MVPVEATLGLVDHEHAAIGQLANAADPAERLAEPGSRLQFDHGLRPYAAGRAHHSHDRRKRVAGSHPVPHDPSFQCSAPDSVIPVAAPRLQPRSGRVKFAAAVAPIRDRLNSRESPLRSVRMAVMRSALLWASRNRWLAQKFPRYRFAKVAVRRFMPGTTVDAALDASERFVPAGIGAIFTRLGENLTEFEAATRVVEHYVDVIDRIAQRNVPAQISVKLTQLGLDISEDGATRNLIALAAHAAEKGNIVWVDMEDSSYVDRTIAAFRAALAVHRNVGLCTQSYLFRTEKDLESLLQETCAIRLVKGAYSEPPTVAFAKKSDVDENYVRLARMMLQASKTITDTPRPVMGTHDSAIINRILTAADGEGVARDGLEIHMLYGISTKEQLRLARDGRRVRVLISYGEEWFPWYVRRLAERPANVWFVVRSMFMG
jgi:proline dehydrogenase